MMKIQYGLGSSFLSKNNKQLQAWQACFPFNLVLTSTSGTLSSQDGNAWEDFDQKNEFLPLIKF